MQKQSLPIYEYDSMNRLIRKKSPAADGGLAVTRYIYDTMGNLRKEIAPNNYDASKDTKELVDTIPGISYTYDTMNRRITTANPDGNIISYNKYDTNGNVVKKVDGLRFSVDMDNSMGTTYTYDGLGKVLQKIDALGNTTLFEYDILGNLTKQTDARGNPTFYVYSPDSTLAKIHYPDGGIWNLPMTSWGERPAKRISWVILHLRL